jgi:hypothetical protein
MGSDYYEVGTLSYESGRSIQWIVDELCLWLIHFFLFSSSWWYIVPYWCISYFLRVTDRSAQEWVAIVRGNSNGYWQKLSGEESHCRQECTYWLQCQGLLLNAECNLMLTPSSLVVSSSCIRFHLISHSSHIVWRLCSPYVLITVHHNLITVLYQLILMTLAPSFCELVLKENNTHTCHYADCQ